MSEALRLARALVALRLAAEEELHAIQRVCPQKELTPFERECVRIAFKAGAAYGAAAKEQSDE